MRFDEENLTFEKLDLDIFKPFSFENMRVLASCEKFTDGRAQFLSARCIFTSAKYNLLIDFNNLDTSSPENLVESRRLLYLPTSLFK